MRSSLEGPCQGCDLNTTVDQITAARKWSLRIDLSPGAKSVEIRYCPKPNIPLRGTTHSFRKIFRRLFPKTTQTWNRTLKCVTQEQLFELPESHGVAELEGSPRDIEMDSAELVLNPSVVKHSTASCSESDCSEIHRSEIHLLMGDRFEADRLPGDFLEIETQYTYPSATSLGSQDPEPVSFVGCRPLETDRSLQRTGNAQPPMLPQLSTWPSSVIPMTEHNFHMWKSPNITNTYPWGPPYHGCSYQSSPALPTSSTLQHFPASESYSRWGPWTSNEDGLMPHAIQRSVRDRTRSTNVISALPSSNLLPPLSCEYCDKTFGGLYRKGNLSRHIRAMHDDVSRSPTKYNCGKCPKVYRRADALRKHERVHHHISHAKLRKSIWEKTYMPRIPPSPLRSVAEDADFENVCDFLAIPPDCTFGLKRDKLSSTPTHCGLCDVAYNRADTLRGHLRQRTVASTSPESRRKELRYPYLHPASRTEDVAELFDDNEHQEVGEVERGCSISVRSFVSSIYDATANGVNAGIAWELPTPPPREHGAAQDEVKRSISLPSTERPLSRHVNLSSGLIGRSISAPYTSAAPVLGQDQFVNTVLQHNQVSLFYARGGPVMWDPDRGDICQRTNSWNLHHGLTVAVRRTIFDTTPNDLGSPTRSLTVTLKPPLPGNIPFSGLIRSTSLENPTFLESAHQLQQMRYALRWKESQPHYFRGGKVSVSSRAPVLEAAYPPLNCQHCDRVFTGQNRRRDLAGHRRRAHHYGSRTKNRRVRSRRSKRFEGRGSISRGCK